MAASTFERALSRVLAHEGGWSDHPKDPGKATNHGITQATYDAWRKRGGDAKQSVLYIGAGEVRAIYRRQYWDLVRGDDLPSGLDYAVFDYAVNSGPGRAVKDLQRVLGVKVDGALGVNTLNALRTRKTVEVVTALCDRRLAFLRSLSTWGTFGKGWARRVSDVRAAAVAMAASPDSPAPATTAAAASGKAKADPADVRVTSTTEAKGGAVAGIGAAGAAISDAAQSIGPASDASEVLKWVFLALTIAGVALTVWALVHRLKEQS